MSHPEYGKAGHDRQALIGEKARIPYCAQMPKWKRRQDKSLSCCINLLVQPLEDRWGIATSHIETLRLLLLRPACVNSHSLVVMDGRHLITLC